MHRILISISFVTLLSACDVLQGKSETADPIFSEPASVDTAQLDEVTVSPEIEGTSAFTGTASTVAGLGDPTVPGLWMETPLVKSEQKARVRSAGGAEVTLILRPIAGEASAGSRLSIDAMRALGAPLTELVELQVSAAS